MLQPYRMSDSMIQNNIWSWISKATGHVLGLLDNYADSKYHQFIEPLEPDWQICSDHIGPQDHPGFVDPVDDFVPIGPRHDFCSLVPWIRPQSEIQIAFLVRWKVNPYQWKTIWCLFGRLWSDISSAFQAQIWSLDAGITMNAFPTDDILNVAVQANIRSSLRLTSDISQALKCPVFDLPDTGAKMVYPTSHIVHLADQSSHHPLLATISQKLRILYNLLQHHRMCPEWITPQLRAIEQRINDLTPNTPSIPIKHIPSLSIPTETVPYSKPLKPPQSPRRIKRKSKAKKSRLKKSKYHRHCSSNTVRSTKTRHVSSQRNSTEFKQLRNKITLIDRKMDALQHRLDSTFDHDPKSPATKRRVVARKKKKRRRCKSAVSRSRQQRSVEILQKMQKLQSLQKQAMSRLQGSALDKMDPLQSMIAAERTGPNVDSEVMSTVVDEEQASLKKEVESHRNTIQELQRKIEGMKQRDDSIYELTMQIRERAELSLGNGHAQPDNNL